MTDKVPGAHRPPDGQAHRESVEIPFHEIVSALRQILGVRLVAYIGGESKAQYVTEWAGGSSKPGEADQLRLRHALRAATLLRKRYDPITIQSWFKGMNPSLGDEAPAMVLRDGDPTEAAGRVIDAAIDFAYVS